MSVDFITEGSVIMDYAQEFWLKVKVKMSWWWIYFLQTCFSFDETLTDGLEWIIVMFLSAVWTLILTAPIHCLASIGEQAM